MASGELNAFLSATHIPAYTNGMGRGTIPPTSPEFLSRSRREAMKQSTRLIVYERLMPETAMDDPSAIMLDLHMMAITGGKARTKSEMEALIVDTGLAIIENRQTNEGLAFIDIKRPESEPQP